MQSIRTCLSGAITGASTTLAITTDTVLNWVLLGINIAILVSNAALDIYKSWKEKKKIEK